jgi:SHS2 domain-containing protein
MSDFTLFDHGADIGIEGRGSTIEEAFVNAALALTSIIIDPERVGSAESVPIRCEAEETEILFYDWINAIIYEMSSKKMLFSHYHVAIKNGKLSGTAEGEAIDMERHHPTVEVKGATFTELSVTGSAPGWIARCVVDV